MSKTTLTNTIPAPARAAVFRSEAGRAPGAAADMMPASARTAHVDVTRALPGPSTPRMVVATAIGEDGAGADFRAGRMAVTAAAAILLGVGRADLVIVSARDGSPRTLFRGEPAPTSAPVAVSLSHRGGRAVAVAVEPRLRVGIDLERDGLVSRRELRYFATPRERATVLTPTLLWVLKEAAWKALRCDDGLALKELELQLDRSGALRAIALGGRTVRAAAHPFRPWPGHVAAVVRCARGAR